MPLASACAAGEGDASVASAGDRADGPVGGDMDADGDAGSSSSGQDAGDGGDDSDGDGSGGDPGLVPDERDPDTGGEDPDDRPDIDLGPLTSCIKLAAAPCPGNDDSGLVRHAGLSAWSPCRFELADAGTWDERAAVLDALAQRLAELPVAEIDFDRLGVAADGGVSKLAKLEHFARGFRWQDVDFNDGRWMPQGVSGTYDAYEFGAIDGRAMIATSWYHKASVSDLGLPNEVVRISFADVTSLADGGGVPYRHALLVEPFDDGGVPNFKAPQLHAGGIAWVGRYLYVADTARGLRVFDTARMFAVDGDAATAVGYDAQSGEYDAYGYTYVLPQVGAYSFSGASCGARTSFVGVDSTSEPPSLVTGEFHDADIAGKLIRWPLDGDRLELTDPELGTVLATEAFLAQESDMQGAVSVGGEWWLSSSAQSGADGALYQVGHGRPSASHGWVVGPEDMMYARQEGLLWSLNEFAGNRYVFAVDLGAYGAL
ncbi:MAG: hypothetical protein R3A79_25210 [Nannocystaceae bacterium]